MNVEKAQELVVEWGLDSYVAEYEIYWDSADFDFRITRAEALTDKGFLDTYVMQELLKQVEHEASKFWAERCSGAW